MRIYAGRYSGAIKCQNCNDESTFYFPTARKVIFFTIDIALLIVVIIGVFKLTRGEVSVFIFIGYILPWLIYDLAISIYMYYLVCRIGVEINAKGT